MLEVIPEIYILINILAITLYGVNKSYDKYQYLVGIIIIILLIIINMYEYNINRNEKEIRNIIIGGTILYIMIEIGMSKKDKIYNIEYMIIILIITIGMLIIVKAEDYITLYIGIEIQSIAIYIITTYRRTSLYGTESGIKYYIIGGLTSSIILIGICLEYGLTGTLSIIEINMLNMTIPNILIIIGLMIKLGIAPYHMWLPDVYEGTNILTFGYYTIIPKLSIIYVLYQIITGSKSESGSGNVTNYNNNYNNYENYNNFDNYENYNNFDNFEIISTELEITRIIVFIIVGISAGLSLIIGGIMGINQQNIKRLIAYSGISHLGFILIGIYVENKNSIIIYLIIYLIMNIIIIGILINTKEGGIKEWYKISSYKNMSKKKPIQSLILTIILFSMAGIPPLAGFYSKYYILYTALQNNSYFLTIIAILFSTISCYYYLKLIQLLYFNNTDINIKYESLIKTNELGLIIIGILIIQIILPIININIIEG